jgi:hypothetical protein
VKLLHIGIILISSDKPPPMLTYVRIYDSLWTIPSSLLQDFCWN